MKRIVNVLIVVTALLFGAADVYGMPGGNKKTRNKEGRERYTNHASVPEPSTLYAMGAGLALLGGAGWYIRRRK